MNDDAMDPREYLSAMGLMGWSVRDLRTSGKKPFECDGCGMWTADPGARNGLCGPCNEE